MGHHRGALIHSRVPDKKMHTENLPNDSATFLRTWKSLGHQRRILVTKVGGMEEGKRG